MNIVRATEIIREATIDNKAYVFGVFIDFSNTYNLVRHDKLFGRLRNIISIEEIQFLRAIYSRNLISLGKHSFRSNVGVAEGSVISPALFDIYIEDLFKNLTKHGLASREYILASADDILILTTDSNKIKSIFNYTDAWTKENGMKLNIKKSAVV